MKNRKTVVVAFMICAVMLLGVGYAALSDVLDIQGTAQVTQGNAQNAFDGDVYFSAVSTSENGKYTASINTNDNDKASFSVNTLAGEGDFVEIVFTVTNSGNLPAEVKIVTPVAEGVNNPTNTRPGYFGVTYKVDGVELSRTEGVTLPAEGSIDITVKVELLQTPVLEAGDILSGSFGIELIATTTDESVVVGD